MDLKLFLLSKDFVTKSREDLITKASSQKYKGLLDTSNYSTTYNSILKVLGFDYLFEAEEDEDMCLGYIRYLVESGIPIYPIEKEILSSYPSHKWTDLQDKIHLISEPDYFGNVNITDSNYRSLIPAASYVIKRFRQEVRSEQYQTAEEYKSALSCFIKERFQLIQTDTNIAFTIPRAAARSKVRIYIPTSVDMSEVSLLGFFTDFVYEYYCSPYLNLLPSRYIDHIIKVCKVDGNILYFPEKNNANDIYLIYTLEELARKSHCNTIYDLIQYNVDLGEPIKGKSGRYDILYVGNYDETLTVFSQYPSFTISKDQYQTLSSLLLKYPLCTYPKDKNIIAINVDGTKKMLWDALYINSRPIDNDYNNLIRQNVK